jgi:subtilisin-like proprotein convertase family protein
MRIHFSTLKILVVTILFLSAFTGNSYSQIYYNPKIDSVVNLTNQESILKFDRELSGDTLAVIGGIPTRIISRYYQSPFNAKAAQYIYEKMQGFGMSTRYMNNSPSSVNVIGKKTGTKYPNKYYIICAHYDDYSTPFDTVPGADDNASGTCGVLESARLLSAFQTDYTMLFIAFDEEEIGLYGSYAFVDSAYARGDSIMGVINLDMIAYGTSPASKMTVYTNTASRQLGQDFNEVNQKYNIGLILALVNNSNGGGSDHYPFWQKGYKALFAIENEFNPYYHTKEDKFNKIYPPIFVKTIKASIATLLTWATSGKIELSHIPPVSSPDTSAKSLTLKISSPVKIGTGVNAPRLYYKTNSGAYTYLFAVNTYNDSLIFAIPGQTYGTRVTYYFALQDSAGQSVATLPSGGSGVNPPGTTPPPTTFSYSVYAIFGKCSVTTPKPIPDNLLTKDTINVTQTGYAEKVTVNLSLNHTNVGDIALILKKENGFQMTLAQFIGEGGQNYTNTTFDDDAEQSILQASPPFTGTFKPQGQLSIFKDKILNGNWLLLILDNRTGNQGTLLNWCINLKYVNTSVNEITAKLDFGLQQNYPNPFNPRTVIKYSLDKNTYVTLKIYDVLGREVAALVNGKLEAGDYEAIFEGGELKSGMYFCRLTAGDKTQTIKMLLLK